MSHIGQILAKANLFCSPFCRLFASIQKKLYIIVTALSLWEAGKFFVTQSVEIATPSAPQKARNDSKGDCHCEEHSDEAISIFYLKRFR